jgi:hypothetical protein
MGCAPLSYGKLVLKNFNIPHTFILTISLKEKGADEGPTTGLDIFEKRKVSFSCQEIKS